MKKLTNMKILLLSTLLGCNVSEPLPSNEYINENAKSIFISIIGSIPPIYGDTIIKEKIIKLIPPSGEVDLGNLSSKTGTFRMISIGSSLTSGVQNGGLYREAQITSFPNLLANQMKIKFNLPLFGDNDYNGFGYKFASNINDFGTPKYKIVKNNISIKSENPVYLIKYNGDIDNFGIPLMLNGGLGLKPSEYPNNKYLQQFGPYLDRITKSGQESKTLIDEFNTQKFDFFTLETCVTEVFLKYAFDGGRSGGYDLNSLFIAISDPNFLKILKSSKSNSIKGVIFTIPDILDFPIFRFANIQKISNQYKKNLYYIHEGKGVINANSGCYLLPTPNIDSLYDERLPTKRGLSLENPLKSNEVLDPDEVQSIKDNTIQYNAWIRKSGVENNVAVIDLYDIYKLIHKGTFVTNDGVKVDFSFPKGSFYSSDGMNLSSFGQSVITNEIVKIINIQHKSKIPYIKTADFLIK